MPSGAAVDTNGLKSWMMLFSGELSMTSSASAPVPAPPLAEAGAASPAAAPGELGERPDEQAARPAASRPAAASASGLLLVLPLAVNAYLAFVAPAHGESRRWPARGCPGRPSLREAAAAAGYCYLSAGFTTRA